MQKGPWAAGTARIAEPPSATGAHLDLSRLAQNLKLLTELAALFGTPLVMLVAFAAFGATAAAQFRVFDVNADYLTGVGVALILLASIHFWPVPAEHRKALTLLWMLRTGVTLGLMLAFESVYLIDARMYYLSGLALNDPLATMAYGDGTQIVRAIVALLKGITTSYSAMKVMFSYVGLVAVYVFYLAFRTCIGTERIALLYLLGLMPSVLFWTSILGKDPIVLLGIAIYCYGAAGIFVHQRLSMLMFVALGLAIAASIRIWLGVVFLTPLIASYVLAGRTSPAMKALFLAAAIPLFLWALQSFSQKFELETAQDLVMTTDRLSGAWARGGSAQQIEHGFTSIGSMLAFAPIGSFTALFRPLPFEIPNAFGMLAGLENAVILWLFAYGILRRGLSWLRQPVLLCAVLILLVWGTVYGFASYQNLGTAFRFRAQVAPILLMLGIYLAVGDRSLDSVWGARRRQPRQAGQDGPECVESRD